MSVSLTLLADCFYSKFKINFLYLAPLLARGQRIFILCSIGLYLGVCCLSGCHNTFSNRYSSYSFSLILTKLGTHDLDANTQKNC